MTRKIPDMTTISDKLAALCAEKRLAVKDLEPLVTEVSRATLYNWIKGKTRPSGLDGVIALARVFGVSLDWLLDDREDYPPPSALDAAPDPDLEYVLRTVKLIGVEEATRRLVGDPPKRAQTAQTVPMPEPGRYLDPEELEKVRRGAYRNNVSGPTETPAPAPKRRKGHQ